MKFISWILVIINAWFGIRALLNTFHVLQSSKYSQTSTAVFAMVFLCMSTAGIYFLLVKYDVKLALWIGIGPWLIALLFLLINMFTQDYR
ncbi:MAG TPA: hypothetical protein PLZ45_08475 [Ferruginibacter sp.]|nr:hypothetical protein [Chitinophagaceae bacterium]HRI24700.1 hypothetical protein [Ferruginibacter sp.]